jgi:hypothetical protein
MSLIRRYRIRKCGAALSDIGTYSKSKVRLREREDYKQKKIGGLKILEQSEEV